MYEDWVDVKGWLGSEELAYIWLTILEFLTRDDYFLPDFRTTTQALGLNQMKFPCQNG
jgi:hypothetical protein